VDLEYDPKPKTWRVYERRRGKGFKRSDVDGMMHEMYGRHKT